MSLKLKPFFVGYLDVPVGLTGFLIKTCLIIFGAFATGAVLAGMSQDDPGQAGFRFDYGRQTITGIVEPRPYPVLHVTKGTDRIATGKTLMLAGQGKRGATPRLADLGGREIEATGIVVQRGELQMLQLIARNGGIAETAKNVEIPKTLDLGTWRLQGEICDGKCLAGAMNPGRGLAHKACANLCLTGDIPPVFVSTQPIDDEEFLMIGDISGGPLSKDAHHFVGQYVEVEAKIERRGDLLVMLVDSAKIKVIP
ncbi:MAG: hypothetical protein AAF412_01380 [Pseudomonadota bacterium]